MRCVRSRVVVSACYGSVGDVAPCLWMANVIGAAFGGELDVACATNPYFQSELRDDVRFVAVGDEREYEEMLCRSTGEMSHARDGRRVVRWWLSHLDEHFDALTKLVEGADRTIILAHTLDLAVRLLEELDEHPNVKCYSVVLSPALLRTSDECVLPFLAGMMRFLPKRAARRIADFFVDRVFAPELNAFRRKRLGIKKPVRGVFAAEGWFLCRHVVAMFPEVFSIVKSNTARVVHQVDFPYAHADSSAAHECAISRVQEFVTSDDVPTVAFVSASGHPPFASKFFRKAAKAMARLGGGIAKAIFLTTDRSHFEKRDLPLNVLHVNYLPPHSVCRGTRAFERIGVPWNNRVRRRGAAIRDEACRCACRVRSTPQRRVAFAFKRGESHSDAPFDFKSIGSHARTNSARRKYAPNRKDGRAVHSRRSTGARGGHHRECISTIHALNI